MTHAMARYHELKAKHPDIDHDMVMQFAEDMPEQFETALLEYEYGCHIVSKEMYNEAVAHFKNPDGTKGAKWSVEDVENKSGINFDAKDYTELDYAYIANMLYSDYGNIINSDLILKMARAYLEDSDYPGDASERAYYNAKKRIKYFKKH